MAEELGKIEKPEAGQFTNKRKLCLIPLLYSWESAPTEYIQKLELYWRQVREQVVNLESKIGKATRVYHESLTAGGEDGLKILERLNPPSKQITQEKCQNGAQLEVIEDQELVEESMDWERHLFMGFISEKVAKTVSTFFTEASHRRYDYIAKRINETLQESEAAILIIREGHMVQFPADIEVFIVAPPALDEIHRWLRDRSRAEEEKEPEKKRDST
jgi:hypothetical protein